MSDPHYEKALELRADILSEIDEVLERLTPLQERLAILTGRKDAVDMMLSAWGGGIDVYPNVTVERDRERLEDAMDEAVGTKPPSTPAEADKPSRPQDNASKEQVWKEARAIIEQTGEPMSRPDMYAYLTGVVGLKIEGTNPLTVLSTMLWRTRHHSALKHFRTRGYWTADKPYPELGWAESDALEWLEELRRERLSDGTAYDKDREYETGETAPSADVPRRDDSDIV